MKRAAAALWWVPIVLCALVVTLGLPGWLVWVAVGAAVLAMLLPWLERAPAPSARLCRVCGCTEDRACLREGVLDVVACSWVEADLCNACLPGAESLGWTHPPRVLGIVTCEYDPKTGTVEVEL